jgi:hypothetical protein
MALALFLSAGARLFSFQPRAALAQCLLQNAFLALRMLGSGFHQRPQLFGPGSREIGFFLAATIACGASTGAGIGEGTMMMGAEGVACTVRPVERVFPASHSVMPVGSSP